MIGTKKRRDIQKELRKVFAELPTEGPTDWLEREIADAMNEPGRNVEALESLKRFLAETSKRPTPVKRKAVGKKKRRLAASR